jgi:hypothetical protein
VTVESGGPICTTLRTRVRRAFVALVLVLSGLAVAAPAMSMVSFRGDSTLAARAGTGLADDAAGVARGAPDFVVTPRGEAIPVPSGATGPYPTRAPGFQYLEGSGGPGLDARVTGVRVMDANANQGPRAVYMNRTGQTVDPATGRTLPNKDPRAHQYLLPWE